MKVVGVVFVAMVVSWVAMCWILFVAPGEAKQAWKPPWTSRLSYYKDDRTKACFALLESGSHYGPYFAYVPCELLDKADWLYYERKAMGGVEK